MAMRLANIKMSTTVDKAKLIEVLTANLTKHKQIVAEAKEGYRKKAIAALEERLKLFQEGKVVSLGFQLRAPLDYTEVYQNSLDMLQWNTADKVELEADEFRQLVRDQWDWTDDFIGANSAYSALAARALGRVSEDIEVGGSRF